jgi:hypothetical protein
LLSKERGNFTIKTSKVKKLYMLYIIIFYQLIPVTKFTNLVKYRSQERFTSKECSLEEYQLAISDITKSFQTLSKEVIATIKEFSEHADLTEAAGILERIQQAEKAKLELTVQWQVLAQQEGGKGGGDSEEMDDFGASDHQKKELRKKYCAYHAYTLCIFLIIVWRASPFTKEDGTCPALSSGGRGVHVDSSASNPYASAPILCMYCFVVCLSCLS